MHFINIGIIKVMNLKSRIQINIRNMGKILLNPPVNRGVQAAV